MRLAGRWTSGPGVWWRRASAPLRALPWWLRTAGLLLAVWGLAMSAFSYSVFLNLSAHQLSASRATFRFPRAVQEQARAMQGASIVHPRGLPTDGKDRTRWPDLSLPEWEPENRSGPLWRRHDNGTAVTGDRTLVIYVYFEKDELYRENLVTFLEVGVDMVDDVDYLFIIQGHSDVTVPLLCSLCA